MGKYIREKNGKLYLVTSKKVQGVWKQKWTQIIDEKARTVLSNELNCRKDEVEITCFNPSCSNVIRMTQKQKRDLLLSFQKKYKKLVFIACSTDCQTLLYDLMGESKEDSTDLMEKQQHGI